MSTMTTSIPVEDPLPRHFEKAEEDKTITFKECEVFIAGSGPIGATFAREILANTTITRVYMADIGAQNTRMAGSHHKNEIKYQEDLDAFVHVIRAALQHISIPPEDSHLPTLGAAAWAPPPGRHITSSYHNPDQQRDGNLPASYVTRAVGGMATHWTCACPVPHTDESQNKPIGQLEFDNLLNDASQLLNVHHHEFDHSIRHNAVRDTLTAVNYPVANLPLAVERLPNYSNGNINDYVTWTGVDTIFGPQLAAGLHPRFTLAPETLTIRVLPLAGGGGTIQGVLLRDLRTKDLIVVKAKYYILACGAVGTPQILFNSNIQIPPALGRYLSEQSLAFCQIVLRRSIVDNLPATYPHLYNGHAPPDPNDPLPQIPWSDPEPQLTIPYAPNRPWHTQIHRDAFSYGDVGPRADPRVVVDLRWFGKQEINPDNRVEFAVVGPHANVTPHKDAYGMPQATFHVRRSAADGDREHQMMKDMCDVANVLGPYLPNSEPKLMEPGLALHITGTTRLGEITGNPVADAPVLATTVADQNSKVHGYNNLYVGGNGCIPDSTACNPTLTSVAYAIKSARHIATFLP